MEQSEKRSYQRLMKPFLVSFLGRRGTEQVTPLTMATTHDISLDGAAIDISSPLEVGSALEMELCMDNTLFAVSGKVVHNHFHSADTWRTGVQFNTPQYRLFDLLASTLHAPPA